MLSASWKGLYRKAAPAVLLGILVSSRAQAVVIFSDLGVGDSYNLVAGWGVGNVTPDIDYQAAMPFTVGGGSYKLSEVELAVGLVTPPNELSVWLAADAGNEPGAVLESFPFVNQMGPVASANPLLAANSILHPDLLDGTKYWLVAGVPGADTYASWNLNSTGHLGGSSRQNGGAWTFYGGGTAGAFRISGTQTSSSAVPEPSSLVLVVLGLGLAGGTVLRRRGA